MSGKKQDSILEFSSLVAYWRSIALPVALVLVSVEVQRHWGIGSAWIYLFAGLLLGVTWVGTLFGHAWSQRNSGTMIDIVLLLLLFSGVLLPLMSGGKVGADILGSILFWAPAICGWWALSYYDQFLRVLIYTALLYGGLFFLDYPDSARHYYEYALIGVMIVGLVRLVAAGMVSKFSQVLETLRAQTIDASMRDPLTGVASKLYFEAELSHMSAVANRYRFPFSLALCSIDGFDRYIGEHGEDAANDLLKEVSWRIADRIRTPDTICRLQNSEFAILLPNTTEQDALKAVGNIRLSVSGIPHFGDGIVILQMAVNQHRFGEEPMATFEAAYRRLELSRREVVNDSAAGSGTQD